jgi:hypothetical protein
MATTPGDRVADMTVDELRQLIREALLDILDEYAQGTDPDAGLSFRPEVAASLRRFLRERPQGTPLAELAAWEAASDEDLQRFEENLE